MKDEAEVVRLGLICGCTSLQEARQWAADAIEAIPTPDSTLIELATSSTSVAEAVSMLKRLPGEADGARVASAFAKQLLGILKQRPSRAAELAERLDQVVASGDWPEAVPINSGSVTDGFWMAREGTWTFVEAILHFKSILAEVAAK